jgi:hypothetical protein
MCAVIFGCELVASRKNPHLLNLGSIGKLTVPSCSTANTGCVSAPDNITTLKTHVLMLLPLRTGVYSHASASRPGTQLNSSGRSGGFPEHSGRFGSGR